MTFEFFKNIWKLEVLNKSLCHLSLEIDDRPCGQLLVRPAGLRTYLKFAIIQRQSINLGFYN
ncbi:unnamed protein product [Commensalibacter communis]|nr:unnamed protein product [Commensalibacter communis]CAI3943746.1 unnamed protein product [Commensalibacter communis]